MTSQTPGRVAGPRRRAHRWPRSDRALAPLTTLERWMEPQFLPAPILRLIRIAVNIVGATGAAYFAVATLHVFFSTHRPIGIAFFVVQMWVVVAYLIRRPATVVTRRPGDWLLAFAGTFGGVLLRPDGAHPAWGVSLGLALQLVGLVICLAAFLSLGRSFGFAAADRGLVRRGPYAIVRHPIYFSYLFLQAGYLIQSLSVATALVVALVTSCNVGRALAEERILAGDAAYGEYQRRVRWRLIPGVW
ncbi:MAG: isoprenylcysteine carboxylmethyltransferase family protein [Acidobacteriota bacterium]|nr:isoprenylcysteine carboxylmethyltransferase family protein [Acidobacteriota bacterium]